MKKMRKRTIFIIVAVIIIALAVGAYFIFSNRSNESKLESSLTDMGRDFYENFYYKQVGKSSEERTDLLSKFTTIGIKIDLENLGRYDNGKYSKDIKEFVNNKTNKKCNKTNTKVVIYPKSPYGKTDYTVEAQLDCGFKKNK